MCINHPPSKIWLFPFKKRVVKQYFRLFTRSCMLNPQSAMMASPGDNRSSPLRVPSHSPLRSLSSLSDIRLQRHCNTKDGTPFGVTPRRNFSELRLLCSDQASDCVGALGLLYFYLCSIDDHTCITVFIQKKVGINLLIHAVLRRIGISSKHASKVSSQQENILEAVV